MSPSPTEVVVVRGADALAYLDGQCTQDLTGLEVGHLALTLVLDPSGTVVGAARVVRSETDVILLEVPSGTGESVRTRLERFALRTDVTFEGPTRLAEGTAPWLQDEAARVTAGVPGPAELARGLVVHGLAESFRAMTVSFTKGCYPGQELVARMQSRGAAAPWALRACTLSGPAAPGDQVGDPERPGVVTSVARDAATGTWLALCVLHRRDAGATELEVRSTPSVVARFADDPSLRSGRADAP